MGLIHTMVNPIKPDSVAYIENGQATSEDQAMADRLNRLIDIEGLFFSHADDGFISQNLAALTGFRYQRTGTSVESPEPPADIGWPVH